MSRINTKILHGLLNINAPTNHETAMREYIKSLIPRNKQLSKLSDVNTSLSYYLNANKRSTILLDAHMDEIRAQVIGITHQGFLSINFTGALAEFMHGRPVKIFSTKLNKTLPGIILIQQAHLKGVREKHSDPYNKSILYVDIGCSSKRAASAKIEIGDYLLLDYSYRYLNKNIISARGLDNKLGVYSLVQIILYALKHVKTLKYNIVINFSGDEETAKSSIGHLKKFKLKSVIVIDTDWASDMPFINQDIYGSVNIGDGVVVTRSDEDDGLYRTFKNLAHKHKIPIQIAAPTAGGSTLSSYITQYTATTQFIGIPLRNIHSPVETANLKDCLAAIQLVIKFISK